MGEGHVVITGASGLLGTALIESLGRDGIQVVRLVRRDAKGEGESKWDPGAGVIDSKVFSGARAVVHLAGENVGEGRWTDERKKTLLASRTKTTALVVRAISEASPRPRVFVSASAVGLYGDQAPGVVDETSPRGSGFLADVVDAWETEARRAPSDVRLVLARFGVVLSKEGGALAKLLPVFKAGVGGRAGPGDQWMSWIGLPDTVRAIRFVIDNDAVSGPVNIVAPHPVTNEGLAKALGRALGRPAFVPVPTFALKLAFGEMAEGTILASQRVEPKRLLEAGFTFDHPTIDEALPKLIA